MTARSPHGTHRAQDGPEGRDAPAAAMAPGGPEVRGGHEPYARTDPPHITPRTSHDMFTPSASPQPYGRGREHPADIEFPLREGAFRSRTTASGPGVPGVPGVPAAGPAPSARPARRHKADGGERAADPFDPSWVATGLRSLAERALGCDRNGIDVPAAAAEHTGRGHPGCRSGFGSHDEPALGDMPAGSPDASGRSAGDLLLEVLWPWALRTARTQAARLPPGADRDGFQGQILWEVYQAVRRIDWQRYDVWPALLKARLRAAWSAAARAEDPLTRGERQARTAYLAEVEAETQRLGRTLTSAERYAIARHVRPGGGTAPVVLGRRLLSSAGPDDPAAVLQAATGTAAASDDDPAVLLQRAWLRRSVRIWITHDLPPDLRREVFALLERDEADHIGQALLRRLAAYAPALHRRIDG